MTQDIPNISAPHLDIPDLQKLEPRTVSQYAPRILLLFGSLRSTSYSRGVGGARSRTHPAPFRCGNTGLRSARFAASGQRASRSSEGS